MRAFRVLVARLRGLLRRDAIAGEIRDELLFHLEARRAEYEREGLSPDEARRKAAHRFGNLAVLQDAGYDIRGGGILETVWQDVRYSLRLFVRQPGFAVSAILILALGIGASTTVFSMVDAAILHPLPYPHPEQLADVRVHMNASDGRTLKVAPSIEDIRLWAGQDPVIAGTAYEHAAGFGRIADGPEPERVPMDEITEQYLSLFGVTPALGRDFTADDTRPGAPRVVLLGYGYWRRHFGADPNAIGRTIRFDDGPATVVGVLPAWFGGEIWRAMQVPPDRTASRGQGGTVYVRLRPGVTMDEAARVLSAATPSNPTVEVRSLLQEEIRSYSTTVVTLAAAVGLVLLIACVNVAGLLLAGGATRQQELAIRASIGAGRLRLVRQLLTESLLLAAIGGLAGVFLAWLSLDALVANLPLPLPETSPARLNLAVLAAAAALTLVTAILFGLLPALRLSRVRVGAALALAGPRQTGGLSRRAGQSLIGVEVALAVVLLAGAGLMVRSFVRLISIDLGFDPGAILAMRVTPLDANASQAYFSELVRQIRQLPGVRAAGAVDMPPLAGGTSFTIFDVGGEAVQGAITQFVPGYFEAMGMALREGRLPLDADFGAGMPIAVLNETAARTYFGTASAVGRQLSRSRGAGQYDVVAVVSDIRHDGPSRPVQPEVYVPFTRGGNRSLAAGMTIVVRPDRAARGLPDLLRATARRVGGHVLVETVQSGDDWFARMLGVRRQRTVMLALLGSLGLVLALVGVFATTAYAVARRTREIGVRMAFGARVSQVVRMIVRDSALPIAGGIVVGLAGAAAATRVIASFLFETTPTDPGTLAAVALVLALTGCVAAWIPARRAARVDPAAALRME